MDTVPAERLIQEIHTYFDTGSHIYLPPTATYNATGRLLPHRQIPSCTKLQGLLAQRVTPAPHHTTRLPTLMWVTHPL